MEYSGSPAPHASFVHTPGAFESPPLSNTFIDNLQPIAESSAIRPSTSRANVSCAINKNCDNQSSLLRSGSLNILNLNSLSSKLLPFSMHDEKKGDSSQKSPLTLREQLKDEDADSRSDIIYLNNDELRNLENALSELSSCPKDTGAIATTHRRTDSITSDVQTADTDIDALPSLSTDLDNLHIPSSDDMIEQLENQPLPQDVEWVYDKPKYLSFFGERLSTIYEWQSRESFTSTTTYNREAEEKRAIDDLQNNSTAAAILVPKLSEASSNTSPGPRTSGILQSSKIVNSLQSLNTISESVKKLSSNRSVSKVFDRCGGEELMALPVTMFSPLTSPIKANRQNAEQNQRKGSPTPIDEIPVVQSTGPEDESPKPVPQTTLRSSNHLSISSGAVKPDLENVTTPTIDATDPSTADPLGTSLTASVSSASLLRDFTRPTNTVSTSSGTRAIASGTASPPKDLSTSAMAKGTDLDANSFTHSYLSKSAGFCTKGSDETPDDAANSPRGDAVSKTPEEINKANKYPLKATTKCLFWRSVVFGHESKQQFVLRQDSDRIMRVKLEITDGGESFILLDHRGQQIPKRWRVIELPPRLACTITVVYKPRPPLLWHTGILAFCELPRKGKVSSIAVRPRCYVQRLIGYVGSSNLHCDICRGVDERTYWTSAFSVPADLDESLSSKPRPAYYARVSISNIGLRCAWVFAVAMKPNANHDCSLTPLLGVTIRPARFVLQPSQSQEVIVTICDEPREVQVLFYNGDEVLRYLCKFKLVAEGRSELAAPCILPKPHRRLRSAYILCSFDGEPQEMPMEIPPSIQINAYDWHEALRDEQRFRPPTSLTIYPLLTENAPSSSFEASSSLIIGSNLEGDVEMQLEELAHLEHQSTKCVDGRLSTSVLTDGNRKSNEVRRLSSIPIGNIAPTTSDPTRTPDSVICDDIQQYNRSPVFFQNSFPVKHQDDFVPSPTISLRPESQLIFAPWRYKKPTSGILELKLSSSDLSQLLDSDSNSNNTTASPGMSTGTTSSFRRRIRTWRLYWTANPAVADATTSVFSVILPTIPLIVRPGQTHYLPFRFEPPLDTPPGTRFEQRWILTFQFSDDISGSPLLNFTTSDRPTQTAEIVFVANTAKDASPKRLPIARTVVTPKTPLRFKKTPLIFEAENQERQCEIVNTSSGYVIISLGSCSSPFFEVVKPTAKKFFIDPLCSVRLVVRCRLEDIRKESQEDISDSLVLWWSLATDRLHKHETSITMKALL